MLEAIRSAGVTIEIINKRVHIDPDRAVRDIAQDGSARLSLHPSLRPRKAGL